MKPFTEFNDLLDDPPALRKRLRDDGYLFLRGILPKDDVLDLRRQILEFCQEAGWLRPGASLMAGLTDHAPIMERDQEYAPVYARVQALEAFHRLKLHELEWVQSGYRSGDILLFKMLTVHAAATNHTPDRLRLSVDFRYTGESHTVSEYWLEPHFSDLGEAFTWDSMEKEWRDSPTARYWERLPKLKTKTHEWFWETNRQ